MSFPFLFKNVKTVIVIPDYLLIPVWWVVMYTTPGIREKIDAELRRRAPWLLITDCLVINTNI